VPAPVSVAVTPEIMPLVPSAQLIPT